MSISSKVVGGAVLLGGAGLFYLWHRRSMQAQASAVQAAMSRPSIDSLPSDPALQTPVPAPAAITSQGDLRALKAARLAVAPIAVAPITINAFSPINRQGLR